MVSGEGLVKGATDFVDRHRVVPMPCTEVALIFLKIRKLTCLTYQNSVVGQWNIYPITVSNNDPDGNVYVTNMGPTCVLSAPGGPHVGPTNLAIRTVPLNDPPATGWEYSVVNLEEKRLSWIVLLCSVA